jgi:hypothetical protein
MNELESLFNYYFDEWHIDTGNYVKAKVDLLHDSQSARARAFGWVLQTLRGEALDGFVTYGFNAVFCARGPKTAEHRPGVMAWRS